MYPEKICKRKLDSLRIIDDRTTQVTICSFKCVKILRYPPINKRAYVPHLEPKRAFVIVSLNRI